MTTHESRDALTTTRESRDATKTTHESGEAMTTTHEYGVRIGASAALRAGAAAAVLDGERLLLTRRSDIGEWCLPGGGIDPGERRPRRLSGRCWRRPGCGCG
jgi:hypothetical protein